MKTVLDVRNLCFAYHKSPMCLNNITVVLKENQNLMILGDDDAGKTTFLKSVSSFDETYFGQVIYKGKDIKKYADEEKKFSWILSEPALLNSTIRKNLDYACEQIGREFLSESEMSALLAEFLIDREPDYKIKKLSLLEKKKLAFARAWLKNPDVLFLDDQFVGLSEDEKKDMKKLYLKFFEKGQMILFAVSPQTLKEDIKFFEKLNYGKILYLSFSKSYEYKTIKEFFEKKINFDVLKFNDEFVFDKCLVLRRDGVYFLTDDDGTMLKFDKIFYDKLSMLSLKDEEFEDVFVCFDKDFVFDKSDNDMFCKSLKNGTLWMFSVVDGGRII